MKWGLPVGVSPYAGGGGGFKARATPEKCEINCNKTAFRAFSASYSRGGQLKLPRVHVELYRNANE